MHTSVSKYSLANKEKIIQQEKKHSSMDGRYEKQQYGQWKLGNHISVSMICDKLVPEFGHKVNIREISLEERKI